MMRRSNVRGAIATAVLAGTIVLVTSCSFGGNLLAEVDEQVRNATGQTTNELTIGVSGAGSVSPSGVVVISERDSVEITATADSGYNFLRWEKVGGNGEVVFGNATQPVTSVGLTGGSATVQAVFTADSYQLTVTADGNGATTPAGGVTVNHGAGESISATADTGYEFVGWTVTAGAASIAAPNSATTTVTLTSGDATVQANYQLVSYALTITNDGDGNSTSSTTVQHGVQRSISASPNRFYSFDTWVKTGGSGTVSFADAADRTTSVTVTGGDATIEARFKVTSYTLAERGNLYFNVAGQIETAYDMEIDGDYVYIGGQSTSGEGTIMRINVTNRLNPSVDLYGIDTESYPTTGSVRGIALNGTYVYAADYNNGLYRFDRNTLGNKAKDESSSPYQLYDVTLDSNGVPIGISRSEEVVGYRVFSTSLWPVAVESLPGRGNNIRSDGNYAFVTAANAGGDWGEFHSLDISNPGDQGGISLLDTVSVPIGGGTIGDQPSEFVIHEGEYAYMASSNDAVTHMWIDSPQNLATPSELSLSGATPVDIDAGFLSDPNRYYKQIVVTASQDGGGQYDIIDIDGYSSPQVVGGGSASYDGPEVILLDGRYLYAYEDAGGATDRFVIYEIVVD